MARARREESAADNVRMGPLAVFTLMVVICLAVLAVLATATAHATVSLSERRAQATTEAYLDESVAQTFVAALDGELARNVPWEDAVAAARSTALEAVPAEASATFALTATVDDDHCTASFDCGNDRRLEVVLLLGKDGVAAIDEWRMTTVTNDEPPMGNLLGSM